jgi:UTP--glucose-1-phosphate uridylyltransferase
MKIKKAVIPIAGKGTRFLPATKAIAKEIIPIVNVPMIYYVVKEAVESGIEEIVFITSEGKKEVEKFFSPSKELESFLEKNNKQKELEVVKNLGSFVKYETVLQKEQLGLGHAVLMAKEVINENFAVILGDDITTGDGEPVLKQLITTSENNDNCSVIGVMEVPKEETFRYGIVDGEFISDSTLKMSRMVEKPSPEDAPTNLATPGRYVLSPEIFTILEEIPRGAGGEYQLTDAINVMAQNSKVLAHIFKGDRFDTGNIEGYLNATLEFSLRDEKLRPIMINLMKEKLSKYQGLI